MAQSDLPLAVVLLDRSYDAILRSDYAALGGISAELEKAMAQPGLTGTQLELIRARAERNAVVLMAAQRGIRSARRRLEEIRGASGGLVTYDRSGRRAEVAEGRTLAQRL